MTGRDRAPLDRAIACASPATSLAAARNLRWLRLALPDHGASDVFGVARHGIRSRFPATRDCCFQFLVEFADQLPDDFKERLPGWSERMVVDLDDIDVAHGIGFISDQPDWFPEASPIQEIRPYLEAIDTGAPLALDLSLSRRLLLTLDEHPSVRAHAKVAAVLAARERPEPTTATCDPAGSEAERPGASSEAPESEAPVAGTEALAA